jgi:tetrahydromethanopterin S-methyltransferase subunit C
MADNQTSEIAQAIQEVSDKASLLVHEEIELAKAEMTAKGKQLGMGAGAFGAAGLMGLYAVGAITACLILALSTAIAGWLAALIVGVVYAAIAGVLALVGKKKTKAGGPPVPERAISSTKEDVEWAKTRAKTARQ